LRIDFAGATRRAERRALKASINLTMNSKHLRRTINAAVADLGHKTKECKESVLIREGYFVGRQFRFENVRAIWFAEEEVVKLYGDDGRLMRTLMVAEGPVELRRAA
jgi:hypothetical protein